MKGKMNTDMGEIIIDRDVLAMPVQPLQIASAS